MIKSKIDIPIFKKIFKDVKNIFAGKVAGYIYDSTDNIVISAFISTITVGYITNYTVITNSVKALAVSILNPIIPMIGNFLVDKNDNREQKKIFLIYSHIRYLIAFFLIIPMTILINDLICLWVGKEMVMNNYIVGLMCINLYIDIVHSSTCDFIISAGLFREDKYIECLGAAVNIVVSLILVRHCGVIGVLTGTTISQITFWIGRSVILYFKYLKASVYDFVKYWLKNIMYFTLFILGIKLAQLVVNIIIIDNQLESFLVNAIVIEIVLFLFALVLFVFFGEQRKINRYILNTLKRVFE